MLFGKITENGLKYAKNPIRWNGRDIFTTDPRPYGYKPVVIPEPPESDSSHVAVFDGWEENETEIVQKWRLEELTDIPDAEALAIITGGAV